MFTFGRIIATILFIDSIEIQGTMSLYVVAYIMQEYFESLCVDAHEKKCKEGENGASQILLRLIVKNMCEVIHLNSVRQNKNNHIWCIVLLCMDAEFWSLF